MFCLDDTSHAAASPRRSCPAALFCIDSQIRPPGPAPGLRPAAGFPRRIRRRPARRPRRPAPFAPPAPVRWPCPLPRSRSPPAPVSPAAARPVPASRSAAGDPPKPATRPRRPPAAPALPRLDAVPAGQLTAERLHSAVMSRMTLPT